MDSVIISALIAAIASIATCLIGLHSGATELVSPPTRKLLDAQLLGLLAPVHKLLTFHDDNNWVSVCPLIRDLIDQHYALTPPLLLSKYQALASQDAPSETAVREFRTIVSSLYNWTRKKLGYPFDSSQIRKEFTPTHDQNQTIRGYFALGIFLAILLLLAGMLLTYSDSFDSEKLVDALPTIGSILFIYFGGIFVFRTLFQNSN